MKQLTIFLISLLSLCCLFSCSEKSDVEKKSDQVFKEENTITLDNDSVIYDFFQNFNEAELENLKKVNTPWDKNICPIEFTEKGKHDGILQLPITKINYSINIGKEENQFLKFYYGFFPQSRKWNVSDGLRALIICEGNSFVDTVFFAYVNPTDNFKKENISLKKYANEKVKITFICNNDRGKNTNGDWLVWAYPRIVLEANEK